MFFLKKIFLPSELSVSSFYLGIDNGFLLGASHLYFSIPTKGTVRPTAAGMRRGTWKDVHIVVAGKPSGALLRQKALSPKFLGTA